MTYSIKLLFLNEYNFMVFYINTKHLETCIRNQHTVLLLETLFSMNAF